MTHRRGDILCERDTGEIVVVLGPCARRAFVESSIFPWGNPFPWIDGQAWKVELEHRNLKNYVKIGRL